MQPDEQGGIVEQIKRATEETRARRAAIAASQPPPRPWTRASDLAEARQVLASNPLSAWPWWRRAWWKICGVATTVATRKSRAKTP